MDTCANILSYPVTLSPLSLPLTCQFNKGLYGQMCWGVGTDCAEKAIKRHHNIKIGLLPSYIHKEIFSLIGGPLKCRPLIKMQL